MEDPQVEFVLGSDVDRDGMFLELDLVTSTERPTVCEIFYSDQHRTFTLTAYESIELPLEQVEEFIHTARRRLPESEPSA